MRLSTSRLRNGGGGAVPSSRVVGHVPAERRAGARRARRHAAPAQPAAARRAEAAGGAGGAALGHLRDPGGVRFLLCAARSCGSNGAVATHPCWPGGATSARLLTPSHAFSRLLTPAHACSRLRAVRCGRRLLLQREPVAGGDRPPRALRLRQWAGGARDGRLPRQLARGRPRDPLAHAPHRSGLKQPGPLLGTAPRDGASGLFHGVPRAARPKDTCSARSSPRPERRRRPFQAQSSLYLYYSTFQARRRTRSPVHPTQAPPSSR